MKKVLLIGDSICLGYNDFVRKRLADVAEVFYPGNCMFTQYTLRMLQDWKGGLELEDVDVIHWNNGLWDVAHLGVGSSYEAEGRTAEVGGDCDGEKNFEDEPLTPPEVYEYMLGRICKRLKVLFPGARVVFALTTPATYEETPWLRRTNPEIIEYNRIAREVMAKHDIPVNDLYTFSDEHCSEQHRDWVHYTEEGSDKLAEKVVEEISKYL